MKQTYIVKAYRTAVGKAPKGVFRFKRTDELAAETIQHMMNELPELNKTRIDDVQKDDKRKKLTKPFIYSNAVLIPLIITFAIVVGASLMLKTPSNIVTFLIVGFPFIIILFGVMYAIGSVLSEK